MHPAVRRQRVGQRHTIAAAAAEVSDAFPDPWLRSYSVKANDVPAVIAAVALTHDLTMVTHNVAELARIAQLRVVDWR